LRKNYNSGVAAVPRVAIAAQAPVPTPAAKEDRISEVSEVMVEVSLEVKVMDEVTMHSHAAT
jgi:hypothetical protein